MGHDIPEEGKSPIDMMSQEDIENWITLFANAAERAMKAGMDMVLIHGGHGILVSNFFLATVQPPNRSIWRQHRKQSSICL